MKTLHLQDYLHNQECCHAARTIIRGAADNAHTHDFCELFWITSGRGIHQINAAERELNPGDLFFIRPEDQHDFCSVGSVPLQLVGVAFLNQVVVALAERYTILRTGFWNSSAQLPHSLSLSTEKIRVLMANYRELSLQRSDPFALDLFIMQVVAMVTAPIESHHTQGVPVWLREACEKIADPQYFQVGVPAFVKLAGRSHEHVSRVARAVLKRSPSEIVNQARLQFAADQLVTTDRTLLDIALDCGFESMAYFHRCFKTKFGETPHHYRVRHRALV